MPMLFQGVHQDTNPDFRNPFAHSSIKLTNDDSMSDSKEIQGRISSANPD
jgi:hypothetical protein